MREGDLHVLVLAAVSVVVVQQAIGVGRLDHLHQNGRELPFQGQKPLGEGGGRHLDPALVTGVDLEVVPVSGVEPQQAESLGPSVLPWNKIPVSKY